MRARPATRSIATSRTTRTGVCNGPTPDAVAEPVRISRRLPVEHRDPRVPVCVSRPADVARGRPVLVRRADPDDGPAAPWRRQHADPVLAAAAAAVPIPDGGYDLQRHHRPGSGLRAADALLRQHL